MKMLNKSYEDLLEEARGHRKKLDTSTTTREKIVNRGRYLRTLRKACRLSPDGVLEPYVTGKDEEISIKDEIRDQAAKHIEIIETAIPENKKDPKMENNTLLNECGLKIRRLATNFTQVNFAGEAVTPRNIARSSAGLAGTAVKAPFMVTSRVASAIGPLAVKVLTLPFAMFELGLNYVYDISTGKIKDHPYKDCYVGKISISLGKGIKDLSNIIYKNVGKL